MPELPDLVVYRERLEARVAGRPLVGVRVANPFVLRTWDPPIDEAAGRTVEHVSLLGKRVVWHLSGDLFLFAHLMIAGRLRWRERGTKPPGRRGLAALDFESGTLLFTEEGTKRRAALYLVRGLEALRAHDPGGIDPLAADLPAFRRALLAERHTLKRSLTDPHIFSGIGNAYSDEILHRARLSPLQLSSNLDEQELERLHASTGDVLNEWIERLRAEVGEGFPEKVTAFREGMTVHGRHRQPCPVCGAPVQRIVYAENETNYCAGCQTGGRLLADRALSRLLKKDWPKSLDELERGAGNGPRRPA